LLNAEFRNPKSALLIPQAEVAELADLPAGRQARFGEEKMKWSVYCLSSLIRNYIYVGLTDNIPRRIKQHNDGKEQTTKPYRPFKLIHLERFETRVEARVREKFLKSGVGKEWLRNIREEQNKK